MAGQKADVTQKTRIHLPSATEPNHFLLRPKRITSLTVLELCLSSHLFFERMEGKTDLERRGCVKCGEAAEAFRPSSQRRREGMEPHAGRGEVHDERGRKR